MRVKYAESVFIESIKRIRNLYEGGHRVIVSFSGGKDSGVCLELAIIAAEETGNLPVEVVMRDEEIMFPGTFEYSERIYHRKETDFHWLIAGQPIINCFNRENPFFWVFDTRLKPSEWVRQPPDFAEYIKDLSITRMITTKRYPPAEGKDLFAIIGLRTAESKRRIMAVASARGYTTKANVAGCRRANPIYDWKDGDVWKAIQDNKWDYNRAYDVMWRHGISRNRLRIAPPTLTTASVPQLQKASQAWPLWFGKVCRRLPGVRAAARYGKISVLPNRRLNESWQECYERTCIKEAPEWIRKRSIKARDYVLRSHSKHSTSPYPQRKGCDRCPVPKSWRDLAYKMFMGNPFSFGGQFDKMLPEVEPEEFREGAGKWFGKPTW